MTSQHQEEQLLQRLREEGLTTTSTVDDDISIVRVAAADGSASAFFLPINNCSTSTPSTSDILFTKLDPYFAALSDESVDIDKIRNQIMPAYQMGCNAAEGGMCPHISFETLAQNAAAGNLQCIDLEVNDHAKDDVDNDNGNDASASKKTTATTTVLRLYYDDSAVLKGRARNDLVSKWTTTTTATTLIKVDDDDDDEGTTKEFYGDVFVAAICQQDKTSNYYKSLTVQDVEQALQR